MRRLATPLVATAAVLAWWVGTTLTSIASGPQVSLTCERINIIYTVPHNGGGVSTPPTIGAPTTPIPVIYCQASDEISTDGTKTSINTAARGTTAKYNWWDNPLEQVEVPTASMAVDDVCTYTTTTTGSPRSALVPMPIMPPKPPAGHNPSHHDTEEDSNSQWSQDRQKPGQPPNQHFTRLWNAVLHLREVITAEVVGAFLFGRWTRSYYRRSRKRRNSRRRRRRVRRLLSFVSRVCQMFRELWPRIRGTPSTGHGTDQNESVTTYRSAAHAEEAIRATDDVATGTPRDGTDSSCAKVGDSLRLSRNASTAKTVSEETLHESIDPLASMSPLPEPLVPVPSGAVIEATASELPPLVGSLSPYPMVRAEETTDQSSAIVRSPADAALNESSTSVSPLVELLLAACESSDAEIVPESVVLTFVSFLVPATELATESSHSSTTHPLTEAGSDQSSISVERPSLGGTYDAAETAYRAGHVPTVDPSQRFRDEYFVQRYTDKLGNTGCDSSDEKERKRRIFHAGFVAGFGHD